MQYQDIRYSSSHTTLPTYQLMMLRNPVNQNANVPNSQVHINNNRVNPPFPYDLPPRPPEYPIEQKIGNNSNLNQSPLMFNLNSPRIKMKLGNRPTSIPTNKSLSNFNFKTENEQSNNQTSLINQGRREDLPQNATGFINNFTDIPSMMAINIKNQQSPVKVSSSNRYENVHSHRQTRNFAPLNDKQYLNANNFKAENYMHGLDNSGLSKTTQGYISSKDSTVHQDNRYLLEEIKLQKQTIQNFQSQIMRLNTQVRQLKTNQQSYKKQYGETKRNSSGNTLDRTQTQLNWQQDQNCKLLEEIEKMEKQIKEKDQLNASNQQMCNKYLQHLQKATQQLSNFKDEAAKKMEQQTQHIQVLTLEAKRLAEVIRNNQMSENNYKGIIEESNKQKTRLNHIIEGLYQQIKQKQADRKQLQIDELQIQLEDFKAKYQNQIQLYAELQLKIKIHKTENDRIRNEVDSQKKKWLVQKNKFQQRERLVHIEKTQTVQKNSELNNELADVNNNFKKLKLSWQEQKALLNSKLEQYSNQKQVLNSQIKRKWLQNESMRSYMQEKDNYIDQMHQTINNKQLQYAQVINNLQNKKRQLQNAVFNSDKAKTQKVRANEQLLNRSNQLDKKKTQIRLLSSTILEKNSKLESLQKEIQTLNILSVNKQQENTMLVQKYELLVQSHNKIGRMHLTQKDKIVAQHQQEIHSLMLIINDNENRYQSQLQALKIQLQAIEREKLSLCAEQKQQKLLQLEVNNKNKINKKQIQTDRQSKNNFFELHTSPSKDSAKEAQSIQNQINQNSVTVDMQGLTQMSNLLKVPIQNGIIMSNLILGLKQLIDECQCQKQLSLCYLQLLDIFGINPSQNCHQLLLVQIQGFRNSLQFLIQKLKEEETSAQILVAENQKIKNQLCLQEAKARKIAQELSISNELNLQLNEMVMEQAAKLSSIKRQTQQAILTSQPLQHQPQFFSVNSFEDIIEVERGQNC